MKLLRFSLPVLLFMLILSNGASSATGQFNDFRKALRSGDNETAAVILHEILNSNPFNSGLWKEAADICREQRMASQALVFYKAALNLEKNTRTQAILKNRIDALKKNYCSGLKVDYVVTFATVSVKLLKNILNLPKPAGLQVLESGIRELPGIVVATEKDLKDLEENPGNGTKVAYIDTMQNVKIAKNGKISDNLDNTIPVDRMPSYNQAELMKNLQYPEEAIMNRQQGTVIVKVFINAQGKPIKPEIKSTDNKIFNKAAMDAVLKTKYMPAQQNGQPVGCWMFITIEFVLKK